MTVIRVDPHSVRAYGRGAQAAFDAMHASLVRLVDDLVAVRWFGPNAVACKAHSGRLAAEFAHRMHVDLAAMADAVRTSTSNIAAALGGGPIQLHIDQRPITPPAPVAVDHVDVDTAALEAMIPLVAQRFDELRGQLAAFAVRLRGRPDDRPAAACWWRQRRIPPRCPVPGWPGCCLSGPWHRPHHTAACRSMAGWP